VTRLRLDQLPAAMRAQVEAAIGAPTKVPRTTAHVAAGRGHLPYQCHACGRVAASWADAERHARAADHHRIELVVS
jgi:hypothetical protein